MISERAKEINYWKRQIRIKKNQLIGCTDNNQILKLQMGIKADEIDLKAAKELPMTYDITNSNELDAYMESLFPNRNYQSD